MNYVFVYGLLKRNFSAHNFLKNAEFLGKRLTKYPNYEMVSLGSCPGVYYNPDFGHVSGELYRLTDEEMDVVDGLESNGQVYQRYVIETDQGEKAWMYHLLLDEKGKKGVQTYYTDEKFIQNWKG